MRPAFACDLAELTDAPDCDLCPGCGGGDVDPLADAPTDGNGKRYCCVGYVYDYNLGRYVDCPTCHGESKV